MNRTLTLSAIAGTMLAASAAQAVVITQNASQAITAGNSVSCNAGGLHTENSYYRGFELSEHAITGPFQVMFVQFAVEFANDGSNTGQPVDVLIYDGFTRVGSNLNLGSLLGTFSTTVNDGNLFFHQVAVSGIVTSGRLGVEIKTPNGQAAGHSFFIGSNAGGQTHESYLRAPDCGVVSPTDTAAIGFPNMHIIMNVEGQQVVPEPASMAVLGVGALALIRRRRNR